MVKAQIYVCYGLCVDAIYVLEYIFIWILSYIIINILANFKKGKIEDDDRWSQQTIIMVESVYFAVLT